ncbi:STAS-like domain-containing protein (plasmid) [Pseudomonas sp. BYT-5]|uniref:STAS-like domain-containing protein n=1 Tax=unclassified Pseudomonas TaxID=196821 RepID=UPI002020F9CF|nr:MULTISPECIES: STAS-like domain-containing protein [unclassified Pseudomonas]URD45484.1 STAS-like domain-containing protein [Pseudomonas sp. BYT-5]URL00690.1 STAS-like domain-containing protein [Pseudomonas sp. BYT-1]
MQTQIRLKKDSSIRTYGMRASAIPYREKIELSLNAGEDVVIDFAGTDVTQSFVDELIGALILKNGRDIISHLAFENCTSDVKGIIKFVVRDRLIQMQKQAVA